MDVQCVFDGISQFDWCGVEICVDEVGLVVVVIDQEIGGLYVLQCDIGGFELVGFVFGFVGWVEGGY